MRKHYFNIIFIAFAIFTFIFSTKSADAIVFIGAGDIADTAPDPSIKTGNLIKSVIQNDPTALVFALGDNAYDKGTPSEFATRYEPRWGSFRLKTRPVPGNHEYGTSGASGHYDYFCPNPNSCSIPSGNKDKYYVFTHGTWRIYALNSELSGTAFTDQVNWFKADLAANPTQCSAMYFHKPRFSSADHGDTAGMQPLWLAAYNAGVDLALAGHDHNYERFYAVNASSQRDDARGIVSFVVGSGGAGLDSCPSSRRPISASCISQHGVLKLNLNDTNFSWQWMPVSGSTSDTGTANCVTAGNVPVPSQTVTPTRTPTMTPTVTPTKTPTPTRTPTLTLTKTPTPIPSVIGTRVKLNPTDDAYVSKSDDDENYGDKKHVNVDGSPLEVSYLKFNLSNISSSSVTSAVLRLRVTNSSNASINVRRVNNTTWKEEKITYKNRPDFSSILGKLRPGDRNAYVELNITDEVKRKSGNYMSIAIESSWSNGVDFYSKETGTSSYRPSLFIFSQ